VNYFVIVEMMGFAFFRSILTFVQLPRNVYARNLQQAFGGGICKFLTRTFVRESNYCEKSGGVS
jgi:hypothetical protein